MGISRNELPTLLRNAPQLAFDINALGLISGKLRDLSSATIFQTNNSNSRPNLDNPVQVFAITRTGVGRITRPTGDAKSWYHFLLNAHRFFPERSYFWESVKNDEHGRKIADFFHYMSRPYIDLAGNGPVQTFCKVMETTGNAQADGMISETIVCVDMQVPVRELEARLTDRLRPFNAGATAKLEYIINTKSQHVQLGETNNNPTASSVQGKIQDLIRDNQFDEILGGIDVLVSSESENEKPQVPTLIRELMHQYIPFGDSIIDIWEVLHPGGSRLLFTVPESFTYIEGKDNLVKLKLLGFHIDLAAPQRANIYYGFAALCFFVLAALVLIPGVLGRRLAVKYLAHLQLMMNTVRTAFCHLDGTDEILFTNKAFRDLTGYTEEELRGKNLRTMLPPTSLNRYHEVRKVRAAFRGSRPYEVELKTKNEQPSKIVISGVPVLMTKPRLDQVWSSEAPAPDTFGIFLRPNEMAEGIDYLPLEMALAEFKQKIWTQ
jgi:PAS domain S-box-containing protein